MPGFNVSVYPVNGDPPSYGVDQKYCREFGREYGSGLTVGVSGTDISITRQILHFLVYELMNEFGRFITGVYLYFINTEYVVVDVIIEDMETVAGDVVVVGHAYGPPATPFHWGRGIEDCNGVVNKEDTVAVAAM